MKLSNPYIRVSRVPSMPSRYSWAAGLTSLWLIAALQLAYADVLHFAKFRQQAVFMDRTVVPPGGEVPIKYDAGDRWIPYFVTSTPSILKSAAPLVSEVLFNPPIEGIVNRVVAYHQRVEYPNSIATHVIPNNHGDVLAKSQNVQIAARIGDFYVIQTKGALPPYVPVSAITVEATALSTGQVPPVTPVPTMVSASATPAGGSAHAGVSVVPQGKPSEGALYGRLQVAYSLGGRALAEGDYVQIQYDNGDDWLLSSEGGGGTPTISKAAVELADRVNYYVALGGRVTRPSKLFNTFPDLRKNPSTLDQLQAFASLNADVKPGDELIITAKEGSDYLVELQAHGPNGIGRIPVDAVEIVAGDPASGSPVRIPARPQNTTPSAPGYHPPPPKPDDPTDFLTGRVIPFGVLSVVIAAVGAFVRRAANTSQIKPGEADYGVPHTRFERTDKGFKVVFARSSKAFYIATHATGNMKSPNGLAALFFLALMVLLFMFILLWYGIESFFKTVIQVDGEAVTINGTRMSRDDFVGFSVHQTLTSGGSEVARLGYTFGRRTVSFGGVWDGGKATEVASALNAKLRFAKRSAAESSMSADELRNVRPVDF